MYSDIETKLGMGQWVLKLEQFWPKCQNYHRLGAKRWPMVHGEFDDGCWWLLWRFFCRSHFMTGFREPRSCNQGQLERWPQKWQQHATPSSGGKYRPGRTQGQMSLDKGAAGKWSCEKWEDVRDILVGLRAPSPEAIMRASRLHQSWQSCPPALPRPVQHFHLKDISMVTMITIINHCNHHHSGLINSNSWVRL